MLDSINDLCAVSLRLSDQVEVALSLHHVGVDSL
jgi:hypothetical protein